MVAFSIDPRERVDDLRQSLKVFGQAIKSEIRVATPGIIESFDPATCTATVQPTIQSILSTRDGQAKPLTLPLLLDCPVHMARGSGVSLTLPIAKGMECLVIFGDRCMDAWWQNGGVQPPLVYRMHDLSDGYCIPGISSVPNVLADISTNRAELRTDDGTAMVSLAPDGTARMASGNAEIKVMAGEIIFTVGAITMTISSAGVAIVGGEVTHNGHSIGSDHQHTLVKAGTDLSGVPQ